jgi:hypothetical protein
MKSVFPLEQNSRSRTLKENPFTHPDAFRPHFEEFYVYTGPEADNVDEDGDQMGLIAQTHPDSDSGLDT